MIILESQPEELPENVVRCEFLAKSVECAMFTLCSPTYSTSSTPFGFTNEVLRSPEGLPHRLECFAVVLYVLSLFV